MAQRSFEVRVRAQANEMSAKGREANERGDHEGYIRYFKAWIDLMKMVVTG